MVLNDYGNQRGYLLLNCKGPPPFSVYLLAEFDVGFNLQCSSPIFLFFKDFYFMYMCTL